MGWRRHPRHTCPWGTLPKGPCTPFLPISPLHAMPLLLAISSAPTPRTYPAALPQLGLQEHSGGQLSVHAQRPEKGAMQDPGSVLCPEARVAAGPKLAMGGTAEVPTAPCMHTRTS